MPGIYIAAILTNLIAIAGFGALIYELPKPANGWLLLVAVLICLCCSRWLFTWCARRWITGWPDG